MKEIRKRGKLIMEINHIFSDRRFFLKSRNYYFALLLWFFFSSHCDNAVMNINYHDSRVAGATWLLCETIAENSVNDSPVARSWRQEPTWQKSVDSSLHDSGIDTRSVCATYFSLHPLCWPKWVTAGNKV